jgi:hypothetical protein
MRHPADLPAKLLRHDTAIVTARYHMRRPPFLAVAMRTSARTRSTATALRRGQGLMPIDFGGAGALLIRRDVLERSATTGSATRARRCRPHEFTISEDMHFYQRAREAGLPAVRRLGLECGHFATMEIDGAWNCRTSNARKRRKPPSPRAPSVRRAGRPKLSRRLGAQL